MADHGVDRDELRTPRLSLRRPVRGDVDAIFAIHNDPRAYVHNPADALATREEADQLFTRWEAHWQRHGFGYFVVRRRDSNPPVGFCGIKYMMLNERCILNLFYRFDPTGWGNGLATEAALAVVGWATERLPDPIIARVRPGNVASQRVAQRAGLVRAEHLDRAGEDGVDWIYVSSWSE